MIRLHYGLSFALLLSISSTALGGCEDGSGSDPIDVGSDLSATHDLGAARDLGATLDLGPALDAEISDAGNDLGATPDASDDLGATPDASDDLGATPDASDDLGLVADAAASDAGDDLGTTPDAGPSCGGGFCGANATCEVDGANERCVCDPSHEDPDGDGDCASLCDVGYGGQASAGPSAPAESPSNVFDGTHLTQVTLSAASDVTWLQYDFGDGTPPSVATYWLHGYAFSGAVTISFVLEGSDDAMEWTTLDTRSQTLPLAAAEAGHELTLESTTHHRYYRLRFTDFADGYVRVQELGLATCP